MSLLLRALLFHWRGSGRLHFDLLEVEVVGGGAERVRTSLILIGLLAALIVVFVGLGL